MLQQSNAAPVELPLALPSASFFPEDVARIDRAALRLGERGALRTSSYTIYVDLPGNAEEMLLVHGYTGAYDKVSRRVAAHVLSLDSARPPKPLYGDWSKPAPMTDEVAGDLPDDVLRTLKKRGYLTAMTVEEEEAFFTKLTSQLHHRAIHRPPAYIVVPTYQCNLRCPYCFQDYMRTDPGQAHLLRVMDTEMVDRLLEGMRHIESAHGVPEDIVPPRNITFFGGEPLLAEAHPVIEHLVRKARSLGPARFSAVTNATDLHAYRDLLGPEGISWLQVTLDGPPAEHDRRRIYADGSGSFDRIAGNITMALDLGVKVAIRMNVDRANIELLPRLAAELDARGWSGRAGFSVYIAAIHAANDQTDARATMSSWELNKALAELEETHPSLRRFGCSDDGLLMAARSIFDEHSDPLPSFKAQFCGAHGSMYILDAFGDIYACWERMGDPGIRIGHVEASGQVLMNRAILETWRNRSVISNPVCRRCRYANYCGGGCAVLAEGQHGHIHSNHCDGYANRFRASVAEAYLAHLSGEARAVDAERVCDL